MQHPLTIVAVTIVVVISRVQGDPISTHTKFCEEGQGPCLLLDPSTEKNDNSTAHLSQADADADAGLKTLEDDLETLLFELKSLLSKDQEVRDKEQIASITNKLQLILLKIHGGERFAAPAPALPSTTPPPKAGQVDEVDALIMKKMEEDGGGGEVDVTGLEDSMKEAGRQQGKLVLEAMQMAHNRKIVAKIQTTTPPEVIQMISPGLSTPAPYEVTLPTTTAAQPKENHNPSTLTPTPTGSIEEEATTAQLGRGDELLVETIDITSHLGHPSHHHHLFKMGDLKHEEEKRKLLELISSLNISEGGEEERKRRIQNITNIIELIDEERNKTIAFGDELHRAAEITLEIPGKRRRKKPLSHHHHRQHPRLTLVETNELEDKGKEEDSVYLQHGKGRVLLDKAAVEPPSEVNLNGGFPSSVDKLKAEYPEGTWPESDRWVGSTPPPVANILENIVGVNPTKELPPPIPIYFMEEEGEEQE